MDSLTQGLIGAAAAQSVFARRLGRWAGAIGFVAGLLPDADIFIDPAAQPLLTYELHRGFSHSLLFIPIGGALAALPFFAARRLRPRWREVGLAAILGYATHGLLDTATSYGTQLFWPLSRARIALDWISVVNVAFTLALLAGVVASGVRRRPGAARAALAACAAYLALGALQEHRALAAQAALIDARGHDAIDRRAMPGPLTLLLWRSLYRTPAGTIHADAIRVGLGAPSYREGSAVPSFDAEVEQVIAAAEDPARMRRDLATYRWFTDGWWARIPARPEHVGDMRISAELSELAPIWGISLHPEAEVPVRRETYARDLRPGELWRALVGAHDAYRPLP